MLLTLSGNVCWLTWSLGKLGFAVCDQLAWPLRTSVSTIDCHKIRCVVSWRVWTGKLSCSGMPVSSPRSSRYYHRLWPVLRYWDVNAISITSAWMPLSLDIGSDHLAINADVLFDLHANPIELLPCQSWLSCHSGITLWPLRWYHRLYIPRSISYHWDLLDNHCSHHRACTWKLPILP